VRPIDNSLGATLSAIYCCDGYHRCVRQFRTGE